jgi:zinc protease
MKNRFLVAAMSAILLLSSAQARDGRGGAGARGGYAHGAGHLRDGVAEKKAPATNWKQVPIPKLPPFKPKEPTRIVLPNGMVVFLTENHELPLLSGNAMVRGGSDSEPAEKTGLVELYGATWRTGGTEKFSGDELDDRLEARAAKVETGSSGAATSISFNCLKADFPEVLAIFADLLRHPAFREEKLSLAKKSKYSEISRRNDETGDIADIQTEVLGYGKQSAYARIPEYATVASVTREDLLQWHRQHATPSNIIFGVVGDFDSKEMEATLRKAFEDWPAGDKIESPKVPIEPAKPGIYLVDKSDVNQTEVRMISLGIERRSPDYYALQVLNDVFGGGFSSRLFMNLRTKAGLAYSVHGAVGSGWDHPGLTLVAIGTKTESTVEAIKGLWEQIDLMKKAPPSEDEIKRAKDSILNSFIFRFDTPAKVLREQELYEFYGYPRDFLERFRAGVEKVTSADVYRVANQYLHKEEMKVLVIGNSAEFQKQLGELGPVSPLDITIPPPEGISELRRDPRLQPAAMAVNQSANQEAAEPAAPAQTQEAPPQAPQQAAASGGNAEGKAAIARLIEKTGGADKLASLKTLHLHLKSTQEGVETLIDQDTVYPDKQVLIISFERGAIRQVLTPDAAFMRTGLGMRELSPMQRNVMAAALKCDFLNVLQHAADPKYTFTANGKEKLEETEATIVEINADGATARWWIAPDGTLLQEERTASTPPAPTKFVTKYSRWRSFDGLNYPTRQAMFANGAEQGVTRIMEVGVNQTVDPKLFEK